MGATHRVTRFFLQPLLVFGLSVALIAPASPTFAQVRSSDRVDGHPVKESGIPKAALPDVSMKAGALLTDDGRVLWARNPSDRRSIASITKVMTAVVALEHGDPDEIVTITDASVRVGESSAFLRPGEQLKMRDVLGATLVKSGNDASIALAQHIGGSEDAFVELMNTKAAELGLSRTSFANPHGLDQIGNHSTATDVGVLARYAMTNPVFRDFVKRKSVVIGTGSRAERVESTNILIGNFRGANGVKTGFTSKAGYCVVVSAKRGDIELYAIVLGTGNEYVRFREAADLLDFGFAHYRPQRVASAGTVVGEAPVSDYLDRVVPAAVSTDTTVSVFDLAGTITRSIRMSSVEAPIEVGQRIGVATFTQGDRVIASVPLVATESVPRPTLLQRAGIGIVRAWRWVTKTS